MTNSRSTRMRMVAAAGSLALAVSLVSAPVAFAQDDNPVDTLNGLVEAIEAKDFESLPTFFCEEFAADMGGLDLASMAEGLPPGVLDAFILDVELESAEVLSLTDAEAIVDMTGSMSVDINVDALMPFIEDLAAILGEEVTPDMVQMFTGPMLAQIPTESTDISSEITLVRGETMPWVVCSDLTVRSDMDEAAGADATPAASDGE